MSLLLLKVRRGISDDEELYTMLRTHWHGTVLQSQEYKNKQEQDKAKGQAQIVSLSIYICSFACCAYSRSVKLVKGWGTGQGRANSRVAAITQLLPASMQKPSSVLDLGCSEGYL